MGTSLTILLAEDNEDDIFILARALKSAGLSAPVHICRDGREVLDYIEGQAEFADRDRFPFPRMLILDIKMPKVTGLEVLRFVRNHPACAVIPSIILTSSSHPNDVKAAFELGANAYFTKPATPEGMRDLLTLIHKFWSASLLPGPPERL